MEQFKIVLDGKEYTTINPKARVWREFVKFDEQKKELELINYVDKHAEMIASVFNDEVTADKILDNIDLDDIMPIYNDVFRWLLSQISTKLNKIPNAATPAEQD